MGWQDDPIVAPQQQTAQAKQPWENDPVAYPAQTRVAKGISEAWTAGYQSSLAGLIDRQKLPDIVLDPEHSKWYERAVSTVSTLVNEGPEMIGGMIAGGGAGSYAGPWGAAIGAGAGGFMVPTAIREAYSSALKSGQITASSDFLDRAKIAIKQLGNPDVLKATAKAGVVGAVTGGAGRGAGLLAEAAGFGTKATAASTLGAEGTALVVTPAVMEGRLPEPQEFLDAAILLGGLKGAHVVSSKLTDVYRRTGKTPAEVVADAQKDPTIAQDIVKGTAAEVPVTEFSGTLPGVHGSERPLNEVTSAAKVDEAVRYDGNGGVWGDGFYSAEKGDYAWFRGGDIRMPDYNTATAVNNTFNRAAVVTPETIGPLLKKIGAKDVATPEDLAQLIRDNGYDGAIVRGFSGDAAEKAILKLADQGLLSSRFLNQGGEGMLMSQVVHFAPESGVKLTGEDQTIGPLVKERKRLKDELRKKAQASGFDREQDAAYITRQVNQYAGRKDVIEAQNHDYMLEKYRDEYPRAKQFMDSVEAYRAKIDELSSRISEIANKPAAPEAKPAEPTGLFTEEPTVPRAYEALAREQMLADVLGVDRAPKVAEVMANPEGKITVAKEPNHINYNYIESPTDVQQLHARISEVFKQEIEAQRGTESWNKTQEKADALIRSRDPKDLVGKNYEDLAAEALAQQAMAQRAAFDLAKAASEVRAKGAEATPADHAKVVEAIETLSLLQAVDQKNGADIARALNSRKAAKQANQLGEAAGELLAKYGNDPAKLSEMIGELNTAEGLAKFARDASKATKWEKFIEAWKAGLVSGPVTQAANIIGNFTFAAARPLVDAAAVAVSKTRGALGGADTMSAVEPLARITGNFMGVVDGLKLAGAVLRTGVDMTKAESHRKAIEGPVGEVVRLPFRLLGAGDVFFRAMNERGEAYTLASRQAANEGYNPATREFRERVAELAMNPTDKMQEAIDAAGQRFTFNAPMGEVGRKIQSTVRAAHLELVIPFIQTPTNVLKEMVRLTPAAPLVEQWRADFKAGGAAKDKAIAEMALGTATSGAVMMLALSGSVTGQGDPDPKVRAVQMASGWQPYSIKIGDTYYSYQRLQPLGTLIGMAADAAEVSKHTAVEERDKLGKILATAFGNAVTNQTFLQGISNIMGAITDPDAKGERFIQGMASSMIPGIVGQTAQMMDPYKREVYSVVDAIQYRLPFMREELMPKRDAYGVEIPEADRMGAIVPIVRSQESKDKVRTEAARLGVGVAKAPKSIELPSGGDSKLGKVELTDKQKDIFAESSGKLAHQILDNVVNTPGWDSLPDFAQKATFKQVFEKTRSYGNAMAVPPEQIMYEAQRIANELQLRMQPK